MNPYPDAFSAVMALGVAGVLAGLDATDDEADYVWSMLQSSPLPTTPVAALSQIRSLLTAYREGLKSPGRSS